jgi:hypothetical protein
MHIKPAHSAKPRLTVDDAELVGAEALAFLAAEPERLMRFLDATGLALAELSAEAGTRRMLSAVLAHLLTDEPLLLLFAETTGTPADRIGPAGALLAGDRN